MARGGVFTDKFYLSVIFWGGGGSGIDHLIDTQWGLTVFSRVKRLAKLIGDVLEYKSSQLNSPHRMHR